MRINPRKIRKILRKIWTAPKHIFETLSTQEAPRCIGMNATHITIYLNLENQSNDFSYTIFPVKKNKCWKIFKIMRKSLFNYSFYSHPEIENFRV
jgi:diaminopimelate decarboxylase